MADDCEHTELKSRENTDEEEIKEICKQARDIHKDGGFRHDTHFYKTLLGGDINDVKQLVDYMEKNKMADTLDWLWMRGDYTGPKTLCQRSDKLLMKKSLMFLLMTFLNIILTPLFYAFHILSTSFTNRRNKRISDRVQLPLAFAAFCQCPTMLRYCMSQGVDLDDADEKGNNVFHYIADLSAESDEVALKVYDMMVDFMEDVEMMKMLLIQQRNNAGLTAMELTAKLGSPLLLSKILKTPRLLQADNWLGSSGKGKKQASAENAENGAYRKDSKEKQDHTRLELIDVSMYESGSIVNLSRILNMLSDRDVECMSKEQLGVFNHRNILGKWTELKMKQMLEGVMLFQLLDIGITCVLLFLLSTSIIGTMGISFVTWKMTQDGLIQFTEIKAWMNNESTIFTDEAFHRIISNRRHEMQRDGLFNCSVKTPDLFDELCNETASVLPGLDKYYIKSEQMWNVSIDDLTVNELDVLYDTAMGMDGFHDNFTALYIGRNLQAVLSDIAHTIWRKRMDIFDEIFYLNDPNIQNLYYSLSYEHGGRIVTPSEVWSVNDFWSYLCMSNEYYSVEDLRWTSEHIAPSHHVYNITKDSCYYKLVLSCAQKKGKCDEIDTHSLAHFVVATDQKTIAIRSCETLILVLTILYLTLDFLERCVFASNCIRHHSTCRSMLMSFLGQKVPGSYARKQLSIFSYMSIIIGRIHTHYMEKYDYKTDSLDQLLNSGRVASVLFITAIIIRFVMHIHSLRLIPGIGNFVITTFRMGTNLLHFSTIFGCVVVIFAVLFYILIDDPNCPVQNSVGFKTLGESIFSTFKLTFGHGDLEPFFIDISVKLAYVLYVVIVCLLLLNLIIAIMSTTATDIMAQPWRDCLWKVEWLDEATSTEHSFAILGLPFKRISMLGYYSHKKAGFVTKKMSNNRYKVFIEIFHCPKLNQFI